MRNISKILVGYQLIIGFIASIVYIFRLGEILKEFNLFFIALLVSNLFIVVYNTSYIFSKSGTKSKAVFICNAIYSLFISFQFNIAGVSFSNQIGPRLNFYWGKNHLGIGYGLNIETFNFIVKLLFYDNIKTPNFYISLNIIPFAIASYFFYLVKQVAKSEK